MSKHLAREALINTYIPSLRAYRNNELISVHPQTINSRQGAEHAKAYKVVLKAFLKSGPGVLCVFARK
jgi:hypothetical protein